MSRASKQDLFTGVSLEILSQTKSLKQERSIKFLTPTTEYKMEKQNKT
jgi:hypothetical protein